jgi:hypothetical protein
VIFKWRVGRIVRWLPRLLEPDVVVNDEKDDGEDDDEKDDEDEDDDE